MSSRAVGSRFRGPDVAQQRARATPPLVAVEPSRYHTVVPRCSFFYLFVYKRRVVECADRWCWGGTNSTASRAAVRRCGRPVVGRAVRPSRLARGATARRAVCCPDGFRLRRPSASPLRATRDRARLRAAPGAKVWWLNLLGAAILLCVVWADTTALFLAVLGVGTLPLFAMTAGMNLGIMESVPPGNAPFFLFFLRLPSPVHSVCTQHHSLGGRWKKGTSRVVSVCTRHHPLGGR